MVVRREPNAVRVRTPREGLDSDFGFAALTFALKMEPSQMPFPVAPFERLHGRALLAEVSISARLHTNRPSE